MKIHKIEKSRSIMLLHELTPGGLEQDCDEWLAHKHFNLLLLNMPKHTITKNSLCSIIIITIYYYCNIIIINIIINIIIVIYYYCYYYEAVGWISMLWGTETYKCSFLLNQQMQQLELLHERPCDTSKASVPAHSLSLLEIQRKSGHQWERSLLYHA